MLAVADGVEAEPLGVGDLRLDRVREELALAIELGGPLEQWQHIGPKAQHFWLIANAYERWADERILAWLCRRFAERERLRTAFGDDFDVAPDTGGIATDETRRLREESNELRKEVAQLRKANALQLQELQTLRMQASKQAREATAQRKKESSGGTA